MYEKALRDTKSRYCGKFWTKLPQNFLTTVKSTEKEDSKDRVSHVYVSDLCDFSRLELNSTL